jgi:isopenicillin N synthase-like dioxygenase
LTLPPPGCSREAEAAFAAELREVCHTVGFFYVAGIDHIVSPATRQNALAASRRFFAMPQEKKNAMDNRNSPAFRGYVRLGAENTAGLPDLREQVEFGVEADAPNEGDVSENEKKEPCPPYARLRGPNQWPNDADCPRFREEISRFSDDASLLSRRLTQLLALSLDLPSDAFDFVFGDTPNVQMKIARYPPTTRGEGPAGDDDENKNKVGGEKDDRNEKKVEGSAEVSADAFGVGAHTDSGYLSLLLQDDVGGLAGDERRRRVDRRAAGGEHAGGEPGRDAPAGDARVLPRDAAPRASSGNTSRASQRSVLLEPETGVRLRTDGFAAVGAVDAARGRADGGFGFRRDARRRGKKKEKTASSRRTARTR